MAQLQLQLQLHGSTKNVKTPTEKPLHMTQTLLSELESCKSMAALSTECLRCNNATLTFDLLTPKPNQLIFVP